MAKTKFHGTYMQRLAEKRNIFLEIFLSVISILERDLNSLK